MESIVGFLKGIVATIGLLVASVFGQIDPNTAAVGPVLATDPIVQESTSTPQTAATSPTQPKSQTREETAYELGKMIGALEQQVTELEQKVAQTPAPQPAPTPVTEPVPVQTAQAPAPEPAPQPLPEQPQPSMKEIKLINPIPAKGLGRQYTAQPEVYDETNYIEIGVVIRGDDGSVLKDLTVTVTATDESQNKTINGTGNVTKIYKGETPETVHYYPYHYEFRTEGTHTITFTSSDGQTVSTTVEVSAPEPA